MLPTARGYPSSLEALAAHIEQPRLPELLRRFLYNQQNPNADISPEDIPLNQCPVFHGRIAVYHSAVARFFAPSDLCGMGGMYQERIRSNPNWHGKYAQHDTIFVKRNTGQRRMLGMVIGEFGCSCPLRLLDRPIHVPLLSG